MLEWPEAAHCSSVLTCTSADPAHHMSWPQVVALCELKEASARGALPAGAGSGAGHIEQQLLAW